MLTDCRGLEITCADPAALDIYESSLVDLWNYRLAAPKVLKGALEVDAEFPMAHIVRGYIMSMLESVVVRPKMMAAVEHVRATVDPASSRELLHADALEGLAYSQKKSGNIFRCDACLRAIFFLGEFAHFDILGIE